ncbi:MAG: DNA methyltransferase [Candidatus Gastranaerophilales bacterium]|nr:DNA methyltransferase [Candidatus Gastranaerophilales bacterium]
MPKKSVKQVEQPQKKLRVVRETTAYNDIKLKDWRNYQHIETGSLWNFQSREKGNGHSYDYHGNYIPQIATQLFERYTKSQDVVLDLFLGSGTSAIEAFNMGRRCIGVELKKDMCDLVSNKFTREALDKSIKIITGDSTSTSVKKHIKATLKGLDEENAQFLMLHPPYADIIKFSDLKEDLSNFEKTEDFLEQFKKAAQSGYDCLEKGRFAALIIGDKYADGELIPLGSLCMEKMQEVGFTLKALIVKNIEGNEKAKGKTANLWRYRALAGGFYIFKHEYIYLFQKKR